MPSARATSAAPVMTLAAPKHTEDEHQPETQPRHDRAQNDEPDMALALFLVNCRDVGCARYFRPHSASERT